MSVLKEKIEQRLSDLKGSPKEKHGSLVEAKAAQLVLRDLTLAAEIAKEVALTTYIGKIVEPDMEDVMAVHQLYQAYLGPAYQTLVAEGDIPTPPVATTPPTVKSKEDLVS